MKNKGMLFIAVCLAAALLGIAPDASANGIVYRNVTPAQKAAVTPLAVSSGAVSFPDGVFLGAWTGTQPVLGRMSWGAVNDNGTIANAGSGDWSLGLGMVSYPIMFTVPYPDEPVCIFSPIGTIPLGSNPNMIAMGPGPVFGVDVQFYNAGGNPVTTKFSFVCFQ